MRAVALALLLGSCGTQTREARALQPNPLEALRTAGDVPVSVRLYIYQRDARLPRDYELRNWAQFAVVARDRLRFHVGVVAYDEGDADTRGWDVWLEDGSGKKLAPASREVGRMNRIAINWGLYPYQPTSTDKWCRQPPCLRRLDSPYSAYEGQADFVFQEPDLVARERRLVALVLRRGGVELRYTWRFGDGTEVEHYGRSKVDDELGIIAVPGPNTELAGTTYEDE